MDAITTGMSSEEYSGLLRELERLIGDDVQLSGNNVQISLVMQRQTNESPDQGTPQVEDNTDPEATSQEQHSEPPREQSQQNTQERQPAINKPKAKLIPTSVLARNLFTDGWNSFWHLVFGIFALKFPSIVPMFLIYQILDQKEINVFIDILEFIVGHLVGCVFVYIL